MTAIPPVRQEGSVNTLLAINQTDDYLLLTDMDLLKGAKQNRVVNTSVLLAPRSKQEVNVSCVERSRWTYDSISFKPGPDAMDSKMRAAKAEALYRLDEFLDLFESKLETAVESGSGRTGALRWSGDPKYPGFELAFEGQPVHMAGFEKD